MAFGVEMGPPIRSAVEAFCTADMRCKRRDLNVGQQSLIRGSGRMTFSRLGLPLSSWRASRLIVVTRAPRHSPASSAAYRAEADLGSVISFAGCLSNSDHAAFGVD